MNQFRVLTVLSLAILLLLTGCRVVLVDETLKETAAEPEAKGKEAISLKSSVQFSKDKLVFRGVTDLPKGAVIEASLKVYPEDVTVEQVINGEADPLDESKISQTGEVEDDGSFLIVMKRENPEKRYQVSIQFRPELQPQQVKDQYGETGENIGPGEGVFQYKLDQSEYIGIALYGPLPKLTDGGFYQGKWDLQQSQENSRPS